MKNFFKIKAIGRVKGRFILWSDNWSYQDEKIDLTPWIKRLDRKFYFKWRCYSTIVSFFRWLLNKPIKPEDLAKKIKRELRDFSQLNLGEKEFQKYQDQLLKEFKFYIGIPDDEKKKQI